jgi:tRNA A-37 threonylcarbamoyl transferase component Bud32/tetratricopeptide (TPR) repeat protein
VQGPEHPPCPPDARASREVPTGGTCPGTAGVPTGTALGRVDPLGPVTLEWGVGYAVGTSEGGPVSLDVPGYVLGECLGTGGFGEVFRATHAVIGREVAIKVLHARFSRDPIAVARFVAETRAVNQISHPGIVEAFDFGTLPDGRQYCVMELIRGTTLRDVLRERGRLPLAGALPILRGIAEAVDAAHAAGIAHRDLKPDNVFVLGDGSVKLIDFGLAKLSREEDTRVTETGSVFGTPLYMSPEQCRGKAVTVATDAYSFGALAYHVLVGEPPFSGEALELALHHLNDDPLPPSRRCAELDARVDRVLAALLAKDPLQRSLPLAPAIDAIAGDGALPRVRARRKRPSVQRMIGMLVVAGLGTAIAIPALTRGSGEDTATSTGAADDMCRPAAARLAGIWDDLTKAMLAGKFAAPGISWIAASGQRLERDVDAYAAEWASIHTEACAQNPATDPLFAAQVRNCLESRRFVLQVYLAYVREAEPLELSRAYAGRAPLIPIDRCRDGVAVRSEAPWPADPETLASGIAAAKDAFRGLTSVAAAFPGRGKALDEAFALTLDAAVRLEKLGFLHLVAEPFAGLGLTQALNGRPEGRMTIEHALDIADRGRNDAAATFALVKLAELAMREAPRVAAATAAIEQASELLARAERASERAGRPFESRFHVLHARTEHALLRKDTERAVADADELVGLAEAEQHPPVPTFAIDAHDLAARARSTAGDIEGAIAHRKRMLEIAETQLWREHPRLFWPLRTLAEAQWAAGDREVAGQSFERAAKMLEETTGADDPRVAYAYDWFGHSLHVQGRFVEAIAARRRAAAIMTKVGAAADPHLFVVVHVQLARSLEKRGEYVEAVAALERAFDELMARPQHKPFASPAEVLVELGLLSWDLGRFDDAQRHFTRVDASTLSPTRARDYEALRAQLLSRRSLASALARLDALERACKRLAAERHGDCISAVLSVRAPLLFANRRWHDALAAAEAAIALSPKLKPRSRQSAVAEHSSSLQRWYNYTDVALARVELGQLEAARSVLEEALASADERWPAHPHAAKVRFALARVLWKAGTQPDRARALELAAAARDSLRMMGAGKDNERRTVEAWLRAREE